MADNRFDGGRNAPITYGEPAKVAHVARTIRARRGRRSQGGSRNRPKTIQFRWRKCVDVCCGRNRTPALLWVVGPVRVEFRRSVTVKAAVRQAFRTNGRLTR